MERPDTGPVTVALVEDDDEARSRLVASIRSDPSLRLIGEYRTGGDALAGAAAGAPDVFLVDLGLPDMPGLDVVKRIAARHPSCDILVVTVFGDEESVIGALEAGARGYLLKGALEHDIAEDIRQLRNGGSPLSPVIARQVLKRLLPADHRAGRGFPAHPARDRDAQRHRTRLLLRGDRQLAARIRADGALASEEHLQEARGALEDRSRVRGRSAQVAVRRALCALLLAIALPAPGAEQPDMRVFESAELSQSMLRLGPQDDWDWVPVSLPHNWSLHPPKLGRFGWYRLRLNLEYVPPRGQSLYIPKLSLHEATVYFNREPIWRLSEAYATGVTVAAMHIPVPHNLLRVGENTIHIEVAGLCNWSHGISRVYFGDTNALAARAAKRNLLQGQMIHIVAAAFGAIGILSLWLWLRARHDAALFWYGVSGVVLLLSTVVWYVTLWRAGFSGERLALVFMRYHGYLVPLFVLHLRLAGRKHLALETVMWLLLAAACVSIAIPSRWQALAWTGWGLSFAVLPALFVIPLLRSARLRVTPAVQFLVAADIAATLATLHDWGIRFGVFDFDRFHLI